MRTVPPKTLILSRGIRLLGLAALLAVPLACEIDKGPVSSSAGTAPTPCPTVVQTPGVPALPNCLYGLVVKYGCAASNCHAPGGSGASYMNLTTPQLCFSQTVSVLAIESCSPASNGYEVKPGDGAHSVLVLKLQGTGCGSTQMPLSAAPMSAAEIQQFVDWINSGAPPGP